MRSFRALYKDRKGRKRESSKWYVEFRDHLDTIRRLPAYTDRAASEEFGRKVERLAACRASSMPLDKDLTRWIEALAPSVRDRLARIGLLEAERVAASKSLLAHLDDFQEALRSKGTTEKQARLVHTRAKAVVEGCGFRFWSDISASKVQAYLAERRKGEKGLSAQTSNFYLASFQQFCRWMVMDRRASESPVGHLKRLNVKADRRHDRRALSLDECRKLLDAASKGSEAYAMTGPERALLYRLTLESGLRAGELRSLTRASFDLDADPATVTVRAAYSKHRRDDVLPLRPAMAAALREHLALKLPEAAAFLIPESDDTAKMLRVDLETAGIPYVDDAGRVADFHGLRHTFITNLANGGVHPSTARSLARHSTITLTMDRYTHTVVGQQSEALEKLPDLTTLPASEVQATGTDDRNVLPECLLFSGGQSGTSRDKLGQDARRIRRDTRRREPARTAGKASVDAGENETRRDDRVDEGGGLENRCAARHRGFESLSLRRLFRCGMCRIA